MVNAIEPEVLERIALRTRQDGECIVWTGAIATNGYGRFWIDGTHRPAHRVAYEAVHGPVPSELHMDHLCRNRACVRVDHLEPVTCRENILRGEGLAAENAQKTHCLRDHPLTGDNLFIDSQGKRQCRACYRERKRREHGTEAYRTRVREATRRYRARLRGEA